MVVRATRLTVHFTMLLAVCIAAAPSTWAQQRPGPPQPPVQRPLAGDAASPSPAGKGIIRGVVTALDTGKPIRNATVRVQGSDGPPFESQTLVTDAQGRYEATALKAGRYTITASRTGYLTLAHAQVRARESARPLTLAESSALEKIDIALPRASVIVARVTDQFGDPVRGVVVRPYLPRFANGRRQLSQAGGGGASVTDDRGETRIFGLAPGEYYLAATPDFSTTWRGEIETLYPGTLDVQEAQTFRIGVGEEVFVTFPILRARLSSISGRIVGADGAPLTAPNVSLAHPQLSSGSSRRMNVTPDGSFREDNLAPGEWVITVNEPEYADLRMRLVGEDLHGLMVNTRKGALVKGHVTFEGGAPPKERIELGVSFTGEPSLPMLSAGFIRSGGRVGTIEATPEAQWAFEAQVNGTGAIRARPQNWLLKAVLLDGKDVTDTALDFGAAYAGKPVEVVLTQRRAEVNGSVTTDRGQPVSNYVVVLFPEDDKQWTSFSRYITTGRPDQQGRFRIGNLPPARYLAAAVEYLDAGEERNPEMLARLRRDATEVEVPEGETRSVTLRLTP